MLSGNSELDIERNYTHIYSIVPIPVDEPFTAIDSNLAMANGVAVLKLLALWDCHNPRIHVRVQ
jgi:hypothetical protein